MSHVERDRRSTLAIKQPRSQFEQRRDRAARPHSGSPRRSPPPAPLRGPGSRSRLHAHATRPYPRTSRSAVRRAPRKLTPVADSAVHDRPSRDQARPRCNHVAPARERAAASGAPRPDQPACRRSCRRATRPCRPRARLRQRPGRATASAFLARSRPPRARGRPSSSSSTSGSTTSKRTPSCSRIARRCGEREARTSGRRPDRLGPSGELREEHPDLARGRLGRVGAVHHVLADLDREVAADRAGRGLERIGGADHLARGGDRARRPRAPSRPADRR